MKELASSKLLTASAETAFFQVVWISPVAHVPGEEFLRTLDLFKRDYTAGRDVDVYKVR